MIIAYKVCIWTTQMAAHCESAYELAIYILSCLLFQVNAIPVIAVRRENTYSLEQIQSTAVFNTHTVICGNLSRSRQCVYAISLSAYYVYAAGTCSQRA